MTQLPQFLWVISTIFSQSDITHSSPHGPATPACDLCHVASSWDVDPSKVGFDHQSTEFPLNGRHKTVACKDCHSDLRFTLEKFGCQDCHSDIHEGQFNDDCDHCHSTFGWSDPELMRLIHNETQFPLLAGHSQARCEECHASGRYRGTTLECLGCHQKELSETESPNHALVGFPSNCSLCHTDDGWQGAFYDHRLTNFPLIGRHRYVSCEGCHADRNYQPASSTCFDCHAEDFNRATFPNHVALAFSHDCSMCHTPEGWDGSFAHDHWFPIYSGPHNNTWRSCEECHPNSQSYTEYTCTTCHDRASMDRKHREEGGYTWESSACLRCHPTGRAEDD